MLQKKFEAKVEAIERRLKSSGLLDRCEKVARNHGQKTRSETGSTYKIEEWKFSQGGLDISYYRGVQGQDILQVDYRGKRVLEATSTASWRTEDRPPVVPHSPLNYVVETYMQGGNTWERKVHRYESKGVPSSRVAREKPEKRTVPEEVVSSFRSRFSGF